jgi:hypothetical protein
VLQEIELLVRGRYEEVLAVVILALGVDLTVIADDAVALLLADRRVGQNHVESVPTGTDSATWRVGDLTVARGSLQDVGRCEHFLADYLSSDTQRNFALSLKTFHENSSS